ncbi:MAG: sulfurtransferase [Methanomicrobiales archaeon HGW-Methanomicrobiales-1]|jgi:thiosulfate/3-mercaptopyruvate sulfurtransferase|nr:MAG: sulfurtransferase [Methanomicrobiales archaeon HGW-Methanomicrobiales-1]
MQETDPKSPDKSIVSWVTPEWLDAHRNDPGLVIIDCRQNSHAYFTEHIPGAIYLHEGLLRMHIGGMPVRWIPAEAAQVLFRTLGLGQDNPIVVYSANRPANASAAAAGDGMEAGIIAYSLVRFGCRRVMILDGGLEQWRAEGYPLAQDFGVSTPSPFMVEVPVNLFIGYEECIRIKNDPAVVLLDTRPAAWYEGQGPWRRPGHIPRAVNLPAIRLLDPDNPTLLKPEGVIRAILAGSDISPEKRIICSCGTGRTAVTVFLILKWYLGYPDVVMYEGGFTEWVSHMENKTVTGMLPR